MTWSKSAQIILIGRLLKQKNIDEDLVDLDALVSKDRTLPENIEKVSQALKTYILKSDDNPNLMDDIMQDFYRNAYESGQLDRLYMQDKWKMVINHPSVHLIVGKRGGGKSALDYYLLEGLSKEYDIIPCVLAMPEIEDRLRNLLPSNFDIITDLDEMPESAIILVDEASFRAYARKAGSSENQFLDQAESLSRQNDQTFLYSTHHLGKLDINVIRDADSLIYKQPSLFHMKLERSEIRTMCKHASKQFDKLSSKEERLESSYIYSAEYEGMLTNPLPTFWTEELSKVWKGIKFNKEAPSIKATKRQVVSAVSELISGNGGK